MEKHVFQAKTKEEAVNNAKEALQEVEENLIIKEISEEKGGLFKSKKVEIEVIEKREVIKYIKEYLQQRRANKRKCKYLFCSYTDKQLTRQAINKNIKRIATEYDNINDKNITPKVSSHSFRHSISRYLLIDKGLPISRVKDYLRHTNIETTSKYLENTDEETQELRKSIVF